MKELGLPVSTRLWKQLLVRWSMAEFWALRDGLNLAMEENITKLDVEVDALVLIQLFAQNNLDCHPLSNTIYDCRLLMEKFQTHPP
ncbi:hypothetical protein RHMOL_Rhmol10G0076700 [Rhododendron molle]|uniref:Uncharacterized protein n=1 Tax=Rhododendron molle TaxID=49168 RepID=A0ACC0LZZ8_RHOML|nr:hypothetical protein RHMOL_Rhmol10G0076700 [Rhododendron molle]